MGGHKTISCSVPATKGPNFFDVDPLLFVTGTLDLDATGDYYLKGIFDGQNLYAKADLSFFIWYDDEATEWNISWSPGDKEREFWNRTSFLVYGSYDPRHGAIGAATVSSY